MATENKNIGLKITLGILAVLLIGASTLFFLKNNKLNETKTELEMERTELQSELEDVRDKLIEKINENNGLDERLNQKKDSLDLMINDLNASKATVAQLSKFKNESYKLKREVKKLYAQIDKLKSENVFLSKEKDTLEGQLKSQHQLSDSLTTQVTDAQKIILSASELSVAALKGGAIIEKSSGKQIPTTKARRADKVKICFSVAENRITEKGDKLLFVQVLDANNNVLGENDVVAFDDKTLNYSFKTEFNYNNKALDICEFLTAPKKGFEKGNYFVNVFNGSNLISNTSFVLD